MAARKTASKRTPKKTRRGRSAMDRFENEVLPEDLRDFSRRVRRGLGRVEKEIETARRQRQALWRRRTNRARRDAVKLLQRIERAIEPRGAGKAAKKKPARAKTVRKSTPRKRAAA